MVQTRGCKLLFRAPLFPRTPFLSQSMGKTLSNNISKIWWPAICLQIIVCCVGPWTIKNSQVLCENLKVITGLIAVQKCMDLKLCYPRLVILANLWILKVLTSLSKELYNMKGIKVKPPNCLQMWHVTTHNQKEATAITQLKCRQLTRHRSLGSETFLEANSLKFKFLLRPSLSQILLISPRQHRSTTCKRLILMDRIMRWFRPTKQTNGLKIAWLNSRSQLRLVSVLKIRTK